MQAASPSLHGPFAAAAGDAAAAAAGRPAAAVKPPRSPYVDVQTAVYGRAISSAYIDVRSLVFKDLAARNRYDGVRSLAGHQAALGSCCYEI